MFHAGKQFKGLFFTTAEMRKQLALFPEVVYTDGTYKLFQRNFVLMYLAVEDAHGGAQIVGVGILADEKKATVEWMFREFKRQNYATTNNIKCFMTDKDLVERDAIVTVFPEVSMALCQFHVLKIFQRTITERKMSITSQQLQTCKQYLNRLVASNSEQQYDDIYERFSQNCPKTVVDYFNCNWHPIREQWVKCFMTEKMMGNYTNNRVESFNSNTKKVLKANDRLIPAIHQLFKYINHRDAHMDSDKVQNVLRQERDTPFVDTAETQFKAALTPHAFATVKTELAARHYVDLGLKEDDSEECVVNFNGAQITVSPL